MARYGIARYGPDRSIQVARVEHACPLALLQLTRHLLIIHAYRLVLCPRHVLSCRSLITGALGLALVGFKIFDGLHPP
jgi:hypothetical protein